MLSNLPKVTQPAKGIPGFEPLGYLSPEPPLQSSPSTASVDPKLFPTDPQFLWVPMIQSSWVEMNADLNQDWLTKRQAARGWPGEGAQSSGCLQRNKKMKGASRLGSARMGEWGRECAGGEEPPGTGSTPHIKSTCHLSAHIQEPVLETVPMWIKSHR